MHSLAVFALFATVFCMCETHFSCGTCTMDPSCGWCSAGFGTCMSGSASGPSYGTVCVGTWSYGSCGTCSTYNNDCSGCTNQYPTCGYCHSTGNCQESIGSCSAFEWYITSAQCTYQPGLAGWVIAVIIVAIVVTIAIPVGICICCCCCCAHAAQAAASAQNAGATTYIIAQPQYQSAAPGAPLLQSQM